MSPGAGGGPPLDLLVVEDDPVLREVLELHLRAESWTVRGAADGLAALERCQERRPDIAILDVNLPGRSGIEVCATLRAAYHPSPGVIFVTARGGEMDVILGLEVGADDYVVKPCRPREVVARVRSLARRLRRPQAPPSPEAAPTPALAPRLDEAPLQLGRLHIDVVARRVQVGRAPVRLTPTEFALLHHLARAPDRVFTRAQLLSAVWETDNEGYQRNVDCHVTRLRKKLESAGLAPPPIETIHGVGYRYLPG